LTKSQTTFNGRTAIRKKNTKDCRLEKSIVKSTTANRSVYVIGFPHRDNFLAKEERQVVGGAARPGSRRGLPPGVTVFANARIN